MVVESIVVSCTRCAMGAPVRAGAGACALVVAPDVGVWAGWATVGGRGSRDRVGCCWDWSWGWSVGSGVAGRKWAGGRAVGMGMGWGGRERVLCGAGPVWLVSERGCRAVWDWVSGGGSWVRVWEGARLVAIGQVAFGDAGFGVACACLALVRAEFAVVADGTAASAARAISAR